MLLAVLINPLVETKLGAVMNDEEGLQVRTSLLNPTERVDPLCCCRVENPSTGWYPDDKVVRDTLGREDTLGG